MTDRIPEMDARGARNTSELVQLLVGEQVSIDIRQLPNAPLAAGSLVIDTVTELVDRLGISHDQSLINFGAVAARAVVGRLMQQPGFDVWFGPDMHERLVISVDLSGIDQPTQANAVVTHQNPQSEAGPPAAG